MPNNSATFFGVWDCWTARSYINALLQHLNLTMLLKYLFQFPKQKYM